VAGIVLAVRLRALGDVVLVTPALRALARGHQDRELHVVTDPRYVALLEGLPGIHRVWALERRANAAPALARTLRRRGVAVAVDFFGNPRSALLVAASGASARFGYDLRARRGAYHSVVPRTLPPAPGRRESAVATHLRLAVAAGGIADGEGPRVALAPAAHAAAARALAAAGVAVPEHTVGLVAAGTWPTKTWPLSHAAALARGLVGDGIPVLALTGPGEERVAARLAREPGVRVLPAADVATLAAVIARLRAVVGTDSGPRHLAAALSVPSFAWFGPTHPDTWAPAGPRHAHWWTDLPCRGCDRTACPHWSCMPGLAPDQALTLVRAHLDTHARHASDLGPAARA
jgi:ADP-heptose:LPS heptosyltransferase